MEYWEAETRTHYSNTHHSIQLAKRELISLCYAVFRAAR